MKKAFLSTFLFILLIIACKKEIVQGPPGAPGTSGSVNPAIYAKWKVISTNTLINYLLINPDNTIYQLIEDTASGLHDNYYDVQFITNTQLTLYGGYGSLFNYTVSNDTLKAWNLHNQVIAVKDVDAPEAKDWVTPLLSLDSIVLPYTPSGDICYKDSKIWLVREDTSQLFAIDIRTKTLTSRLNYLGNYQACSVGVQGAAFWIGENYEGRLHKIDPVTGNDLKISNSFTYHYNLIKGIAMQSQQVFIRFGDLSQAYYNPDKDDIEPEFLTKYTMQGIEIVNGHLYGCAYGKILKCSLNPPFRIEKTYEVVRSEGYGGSRTNGLAFDGKDFWITLINVKNDSYDQIELHKVHLD